LHEQATRNSQTLLTYSQALKSRESMIKQIKEREADEVRAKDLERWQSQENIKRAKAIAASNHNKIQIEKKLMSRQLENREELLRGMLQIERDKQLKASYDLEQRNRKL